MSGIMDCARIAAGVILVTLVAGGMGYAIASAVLTFKDLGFSADIDFAYIAQSYLVIRDRRPDDFQLIIFFPHINREARVRGCHSDDPQRGIVQLFVA